MKIDRMTLVILGALALAVVVPIAGPYAKIYDVLTKVAVFVLFFGYGARLSTAETLAGIKHWRLHLTILTCTFILFPILGAPMLLLPDGFVSTPVRTGLVFLCLAPSTVQSSINMTSLAGGNVPAAMISATASNLFGVVLTPLLVWLLLPATGSGLSWEIALDVFIQLLLPFFLGQLSRVVTAQFMARHKQRLRLLDQTVIVLIVYGAFSGMFSTGMWQRIGWTDLAVTLCFTLPLLAFMLWFTWRAAGWLGFPRKDKIAIMFCGTKKSLVTGVPIASVLFPASTVGMLVVPLMIYHQAQIVTASMIAARLSVNTPHEDLND